MVWLAHVRPDLDNRVSVLKVAPNMPSRFSLLLASLAIALWRKRLRALNIHHGKKKYSMVRKKIYHGKKKSSMEIKKSTMVRKKSTMVRKKFLHGRKNYIPWKEKLYNGKVKYQKRTLKTLHH